jgi:hypothetical protein
MRLSMLPFFLLSVLAFGDSMTLRDGRVITGKFLSSDGKIIKFEMGDRVDNAKIEDVQSLTFDVRQPAPPPPPPVTPPPPAGQAISGGAPAANPGVELLAGTPIVVRMIEPIDSEKDPVGKTFRASLDEPINDRLGNTLIPRGADVVVRLIDDKEAGKLAGRTVLTLNLATVAVNGRAVDINTRNITEQSASQTQKSAKVIGGTAVVGAVIGAVAGGGKGAAIGAGAGAGVGTVAEIASKGPKVRVPSETRLTFKLEQPVRI